MENVTNALHMAFAVLIFAMAIVLAFATFSQARQVADVVFYTNDKTNFEDYTIASSMNRTVGLETIIPAVRRYITDNEGYEIRFKDESKGLDLTFDIREQKNQLYQFHIDEEKKNQLIYESSELNQYLKDCLEQITKKYKSTNAKFIETYEEVVISGTKYEMGDGEVADSIIIEEIDGVVIEKINTETKVIITYTRET